MNLAVNFAQRLGADSKFGSGSFHVVTRGNPQYEVQSPQIRGFRLHHLWCHDSLVGAGT